MLLTPLLRPAAVLPIVTLLSISAPPAPAQPTHERTDSVRTLGAPALQPRLQRITGRPEPGSGRWVPLCPLPAACRLEHDAGTRDALPPVALESRRGTYAMVGLVAGAAVGWGWFAYQCSRHDDCYSPMGGVLLAVAGGALGLLVGLLIAPVPGAR